MWMCYSLQPSEESLASRQASHACLPSHYDSAAPGFLPEWRQDVPGPERVHGGSRSAPDWEALGGLPDQALSSSIAVTTRTEKWRLPTPACQPRDDDALLLCGQHMNYARYMTWYLRNIENLSRQTTIRLHSRCRSTRALSM